MKLFCIVLVIFVVALTLCGVEGRGGGTRNGLKGPMAAYFRARRHATDDLAPKGTFANEEPPPPPQFRSRRNAMNMSTNPDDHQHVANEAAHFRQRRQMPPPPEGMSPPPMSPPPQG